MQYMRSVSIKDVASETKVATQEVGCGLVGMCY
jgi:hypothetical protein